MSDAGIERSRKPRRWRLRLAIAAILIVLASIGLSHCDIVQAMRSPSAPFDPKSAPPAPDYGQRKAWLALPDSNGMERSAPAGVVPIDPAKAPADVFFIHPTTFKGNSVWNAAYDASDEVAPLNPPVLLEQLSVFNGCCRMFAPRYRQASLAGLKNAGSFDLAYDDVRRAFRYFIARQSAGRPFILAGHSQGTGHALRLLQDEIIGTPLQARMVAAYLIGGYAPHDYDTIGLPICDAPRQTGCVLAYNTSQAGRNGARMLIDNKTYWWQGKVKLHNPSAPICVNPLTWRDEARDQAAAPAGANAGSVPFPKAPFTPGPAVLPLVSHLTGAACRRGLLEVDIPSSAPKGFRDTLSFLFGSYHLGDYGIFYSALRSNAIDRVAAWQAANPAASR
uniref:DUF3089 domain-containing protein n=1 Tax=uncultured Sphingomonas sp. TaxID=158754 RepID=UPI0035CAA46B